MRIIIALAGMLAISGCSNPASPKFISGNYYMTGDKNCVWVTPVSGTLIMCADKNKNQTGHRNAMTAQDLQIYQIHMANQQYQVQQITQSLDNVNQTFQNAGQQILRQSQQFSPPQVQPITPYGSSGGITYRWAGDTLIGSNGVTYRQAGSSVMGSDGTRCQIAGSNIICR